jgi:hypothetical protein
VNPRQLTETFPNPIERDEIWNPAGRSVNSDWRSKNECGGLSCR